MASLKDIQVEIDASKLYSILAMMEKDPKVSKLYSEMSKIEYNHAISFAYSLGLQQKDLQKPSFRVHVLHFLANRFGSQIILSVLLDTEKRLSKNIVLSKRKLNIPQSISDTSHVAILNNILNNKRDYNHININDYEKQHHTIGGNALRAAVLGGNDGLVSNFCLIMGVTGAGVTQNQIILTGIAGMLAGALSMALGEWISVKSSSELLENQIMLEKQELEINPEGEEKELALIYMSKGMNEQDACQISKNVIADKDKALEILVFEELGVQLYEKTDSPKEAAIASFIFFCIGAILPILPFIFVLGDVGVILSVCLSGIGLFVIGMAITLFTGRNAYFSGLRQVGLGVLAAAITFFVGQFVGEQL